MCCTPVSSFWDIKIHDVASIIIAGVNIILIFYIFIYQRGKDKKDRRLLIDQVHANSKQEWFKLIIIEPNVKRLYDFFDLIKSKLDFYNDSTDINLIRETLIIELNALFNKFEKDFINVLDSVDHVFKENNLDHVDELRDYLAHKISETQILTPDFFSEIEEHLSSARNSIIRNVVNYDFFTVKE